MKGLERGPAVVSASGDVGTADLETTLVPVLDDDVKPLNQKTVKIGANQKLLLDALDQALDQNGQPFLYHVPKTIH